MSGSLTDYNSVNKLKDKETHTKFNHTTEYYQLPSLGLAKTGYYALA